MLVGGRGGVDSICTRAASDDVLVNVSVGGREVGDSCVLQRGMGDIADELFCGFKVSEQVGGGGEARYSRFRFEKTEVLSEEDAEAQRKAARAADEKGEAGEDGKEDVKVGMKDVGLLEVRFATAVRLPPDPDAPPAGGPEGHGGAGGMRLGKEVAGVSSVSELAAAKHGLSVGVAGGGEAVRRQNWMGEGVCYGEDQPEMTVVMRLRERWWLEAKGVLPQASGRWVKDEAPAAEMVVRTGEPVRKKVKKDKGAVVSEVVDLTGGDGEQEGDDDDD